LGKSVKDGDRYYGRLMFVALIGFFASHLVSSSWFSHNCCFWVISWV